jgi:hypothetical protein
VTKARLRASLGGIGMCCTPCALSRTLVTRQLAAEETLQPLTTPFAPSRRLSELPCSLLGVDPPVLLVLEPTSLLRCQLVLAVAVVGQPLAVVNHSSSSPIRQFMHGHSHPRPGQGLPRWSHISTRSTGGCRASAPGPSSLWAWSVSVSRGTHRRGSASRR